MHSLESKYSHNKKSKVLAAAGLGITALALFGPAQNASAEATPETPIATTSAVPTPQTTETIAPIPSQTTIDDGGMTETPTPIPSQTTIDDGNMTESPTPIPSQTTIDDGGMTETPTPTPSESKPVGDSEDNNNHNNTSNTSPTSGHTHHKEQTLPNTGAEVPVGAYGAASLALIGAGVALLRTRAVAENKRNLQNK